jgi:hypothetical protein
MRERLVNGVKPTTILREIKEGNPDADNTEISCIFCELVDHTPTGVVQAIWYWKAGGARNGLEDDELDAIILKEMGIKL